MYINKNAQWLRSLFVKHSGKKRLVVSVVPASTSPGASSDSSDSMTPAAAPMIDFGALAVQMTEQISKNLIDPTLSTYFLPTFSTTTPTDTVVCSVMLMASMQSYFEYTLSLCGIPSITLLGTKGDWEELRRRVERLSQFDFDNGWGGKGREREGECVRWKKLLVPILDAFVDTFEYANSGSSESESTPSPPASERQETPRQGELHDQGLSRPDPSASNVKSGLNKQRKQDCSIGESEREDQRTRLHHFYSTAVSKHSSSGRSYLSGWVTAFCVWDQEGRWMGDEVSSSGSSSTSGREKLKKTSEGGIGLAGLKPPVQPTVLQPTSSTNAGASADSRRSNEKQVEEGAEEEVCYPAVDASKVPMGYCRVDQVRVIGLGPRAINASGTSTDNPKEGHKEPATICEMAAGHMASTVSGQERDIIGLVPCWFLYVKPQVRCDEGRGILGKVKRALFHV